ncbi:hypothetical protein SAMN04487911_1545 [Arenibacter nanhaiticus]|uniref:Uncharacterized protein n=1 Tax=Arenibacter nanhaiticus TaxID=558155 RepID=A0A1M6N3G0_9FLAO|nr:hypothetical protein SAMN04487911_1545 [Arenibacter nanhaiticus]
MTRKHKFHNKSASYFVSFARVYWLDIFISQAYFSILEESVSYCSAEKGMEVFAFCFMPSHACTERSRSIYFVFRTYQEDPSGLLRNFKGYTARKLIK